MGHELTIIGQVHFSKEKVPSFCDICGAGHIDLIAQVRASGAYPIVVTDLEPSRLAFTKDFAPSCITHEVDHTEDSKGNAKAIRALFGSGEHVAPETILECTAVESSVYTAAYTVLREARSWLLVQEEP
ncbi:hypothetical protein PITC_099960 [Penicillium italicum]|uniref:Uncharacterized protein n=1 Tax=Penicillium italicum TaxID=40296 RepID=A0A0A2LD00_PENIT|nr:hypothetical protein PITC_099960 [Penicillium italicum]